MIHSDHSGQMSNCEQIAQDKQAKGSKLFRVTFLWQIAHSLFCSQKMSNLLKNLNKIVCLCTIFKSFFVSLKKQEWCELSTQAAHDKRVTCRSPKMKEWANCSFFSANRSFTSLRLPMRKFPTLQLDHHFLFQLFNVYITFDICKSCSVAAPSTLDIMKLGNTM